MKLKILFTVFCLVLLTLSAAAAVDGSFLKPPAGASVAIVVFEDLECPSCAQRQPLLEQAAKQYNVPLVIHDFPLRMHPWAMDAALITRYLTSQNEQLGREFRDYIFSYQPQITKDNLRSYAEKFAAEHKITLPFIIDPQGKYAAEIKADQDLGTRAQLEETPTIFVVSNASARHVTDPGQLYATIDQMKKEAGAATPAAKPASKATKSPAKRARKTAQ